MNRISLLGKIKKKNHLKNGNGTFFFFFHAENEGFNPVNSVYCFMSTVQFEMFISVFKSGVESTPDIASLYLPR